MKATSKTASGVILVGGTLQSFVWFRQPLLQALSEAGAERITAVYWSNASGFSEPPHERVDWRDLGGSHSGSILGDLLPLMRLSLLILRHPRVQMLAFNAKPIFFCGLLARLLFARARFVALLEGRGTGFSFVGDAEIVARLKTWFLRCATRGFGRWVFLNQDDRSTFAREGLTAPGARSLVVNGIGVDLERFRSQASPQEHWRFKRCVFVGRLIAEKGVMAFARIAELVRSETRQVSFAVAGGESSLPGAITADELKNLETFGVLEEVRNYRDVSELYRKASLLILPTVYKEGLPSAAMEAQAFGLPVLLSDIPQTRAALIDGETGYAIDAGDIDGFAEKVLALLGDEKGYVAMAAAARRYAEKQFDGRATSARLAAFVLNAAG